MKMSADLYGQFLLSSQVNYTGTYLADHLKELTHDQVQYFVKKQCVAPRQLWHQVRGEVVLSDRCYVLFDDTVLDKRHSRRIELVRRQYSGNAHGLIPGIGLVKSNRLVDEAGGVARGKTVKVLAMPKDSKLKLFRVLENTHRTDYLVTNELAQNNTAAAEVESGVRWTIEQLHREAKQLTGLEACQYRLVRSQRNHIGLALRTLTWLKSLVYSSH